MTDIASFRVDLDVTDAQRNVDALADTTASAMNRMEQDSQQSLTASGQDMERLAAIFGQASDSIESAITELIRKEEELGTQTKETADHGALLSNAFSVVGTTLAAAGAAIGATVTAIGALVQATTSAVVETSNYAQVVGISTEAMQAFDFAAQRVGGDTDALRESLRTSQEAIAQFSNDGTGPAAEALELLGLQLTDSTGKVRSMEQLLPELVTALGNIQDPAERSRLAIQLFGEEDSRVMLAMANNPKVLEESRTALERYGLVMGEELVAQSREFQTGVTDLMASLQGLAQELVTALLPTINALLPQFTAWVVSLRESDTVQKEIIPTLQAIIVSMGNLGIAVDVLKIAWAAMNAAFNAAMVLLLEGFGFIAKGLGSLITAAGQAADVLGMDGVADKLRTAGAAVTDVGKAADQMGDVALETMREYQASIDKTVANLGKTTQATQQTTTATKDMGKAATEAGKQATEATRALADETAKAQQQAKNLREAYVGLGLKSSATLRQMADDAVADFRTIQEHGSETPRRLAAIWIEEIVPKIIEAYGKIPPALAEYDRLIRAGAEQTMSSLGRMLEDMGIRTEQALTTTAAAAQRNLETVVSIFGIRSKEAAQAWEATIQDISAGYDSLPPNVERIGRLIAEANQRSATDSATAHQAAVETIVSSYESGFTRIQGIIQATTGVFEDSFQAFGDSAEEIRAQMAALEQQIAALQVDPGFNVMPDLSVTRFQTEQLREAIGALQERLNALSASERDAAQSTDALNTSAQGLSSTLGTLTIRTQLFGREVELVQNRFGEWRPRVEEVTDDLEESTERTESLNTALGRSATVATQTANALHTLSAAHIAYSAAVEEADRRVEASYARAAIRQRASGGRGTGGSMAGGPSSGESLAIGQPPAQVPLGVPFPSDLGLPEGGVRYDPYRSSSARTTVTQTTVVNVQEPITIQTKADSTTMTAQAVIDALNDGIRRGLVRPELSSWLR